MLRLLSSSVIALAVIAAPAAASSADTNGKGQKKERRICKRDMKTDSLVGARRTCLTAAEWKETTRVNQRTLDEWKNKMDGAQVNN